MSNITVKSDGTGITVSAQGPQGATGIGTIDPTKLPLAGGTMFGDIDMAGNNILNNPEIESKLDKLTITDQTVASKVEFFQEITVPPNSIILGVDGAKLSSSARAFQFRDAFQTNQYFPFFEVKSTGNENPKYYQPTDEIQVDVNPDAGTALSDPQDLSFATSASDTFTVAFIIIPATSGNLMVETWSGSDDTGAVLVENMFTVLPGDIGAELQLDIPNPIMLFLGDSIFTRFSGVQLEGAVQSSGPFIGQLKPFLKSCLNLLTPKSLIVQDTDFIDYNNAIPNPSYKEGRVFYDNTKNALSYYNDESETTVNLGQEQIVKVCNKTGGTISNGEAVRVDGSDSGVPCVVKSIADNTSNARVAGVATHDIPDGGTGYITIFGSIGGVNTSSFTEGDILYLSSDTKGKLVNIEQPILHPIALVLTSAVNGVILANPRGIVNITAIAQTRGTSHTQQVTSTPVVCYCFDLSEFELNVTVDQTLNPAAGDDGYSAELSPSSIGATGFYRFTFSISLSSDFNQRVSLELYINGSPSGLVANIDLNNPSTDFGTATLSGVTESTVTPSDILEMYVYTDVASSREITFDSALFGIERIGNA